MKLYVVQPLQFKEKQEKDFAFEFKKACQVGESPSTSCEEYVLGKLAGSIEYKSAKSELVGLFTSLIEAEGAISSNMSDMWEAGMYDWVLISAVPTGTMVPFVHTEHLKLYRWNEKKGGYLPYTNGPARLMNQMIEHFEWKTWQCVELVKTFDSKRLHEKCQITA